MEMRGVKKYQSAFRSDLCRAIWPLYYLGKAWGLIPVRFATHGSEGCRARVSVTDLAYSLGVLALLLAAEIWGLWRDLKDGWEHSTRLKSRTAVIATCSDVLGVMSLTVVCIVASPFRWKRLQLVAKKLIEVDERIGVASPVRRARRFTIGLIVSCLGYLWINSILDFYAWRRKTNVNALDETSGKGPVNYAPLYLMYTVIILTEIQYTVATYNVGQRFVQLNSRLDGLFDGTSACRKSGETDGETYVNRVRELAMIHSSLCDAVSLINCAFGVVILAVTVTCLLHLVITPYFLILQAGEKHEWIFLFVQGGWCIFHIARMLIIVQPSYSTAAKAKRTAVLVSRLLCCSFEANARQELEIFSLQLLHRPLEFSACGLFSLDRSLITSVMRFGMRWRKGVSRKCSSIESKNFPRVLQIAGAVTTYLVILIQFQNADDSKCDATLVRNASQILKDVSVLNLTASVSKNIARGAFAGRR